jgi:hypothetical protein
LESASFQFLYTRRLNQDCLEHFFGAVRKKGGNCYHPTAVQFSAAFKKLSGTKFLDIIRTGNCESVDHLVDPIMDFIPVLPRSTSLPSVYKAQSISISNECKVFDFSESNSIHYIAGFLQKKSQERHTCTAFNLPDNFSMSTTFIRFKQYAGCKLVVPQEAFVNFIIALNHEFLTHFDSLVTKSDLETKLSQHLSLVEPYKCCENVDLNYLFRLFVRLRIYIILKKHNLNYSNKDTRRKIVSVKNL